MGQLLNSGVLHRAIRPALPTRRVAGTAAAVRFPHADSTAIRCLTKSVGRGEIVVIGRCGDDKHGRWRGVIDEPATIFSEIVDTDSQTIEPGNTVFCEESRVAVSKRVRADGSARSSDAERGDRRAGAPSRRRGAPPTCLAPPP